MTEPMVGRLMGMDEVRKEQAKFEAEGYDPRSFAGMREWWQDIPDCEICGEPTDLCEGLCNGGK